MGQRKRAGNKTWEVTCHARKKIEKLELVAFFHHMQLSRAIDRFKRHGGSVTLPRLLLVQILKTRELMEARARERARVLQKLW